MKNKDVLLVSLSDMHSGSTTALFPNRQMTFIHGGKPAIIASPTSEQKQLHDHWVHCGKNIKAMAKSKRLIVVHNGDAIDGNHHGSIQIITPNQKHQTDIHIELMDELLKLSGFSVKNGDELHYTSGTESHTEWAEYGIKEYYNALGAQYHDEMQINVNGRLVWYTHHGANAGKGANEGNGVRGWLRDIYFDCLKSGITPPDMITTSHYHKAHYQPYTDGYNHTIHGQILPSWQRKTRYAYRVAPFQRNDIGMTVTEITAAGDIRIMPPLLMV